MVVGALAACHQIIEYELAFLSYSLSPIIWYFKKLGPHHNIYQFWNVYSKVKLNLLKILFIVFNFYFPFGNDCCIVIFAMESITLQTLLCSQLLFFGEYHHSFFAEEKNVFYSQKGPKVQSWGVWGAIKKGSTQLDQGINLQIITSLSILSYHI